MGKKVGQVRVRLTKTPVHRGPLIVTSPEAPAWWGPVWAMAVRRTVDRLPREKRRQFIRSMADR